MAQTFIITLTTAGNDTGPFNLYSNIDGFTVPFETNVAKPDLIDGYLCNLVPDSASIVRIKSTNPLCSNYIDLLVPEAPTTTTTSSSSSTTTTTTSTTIAVEFMVDVYAGLSNELSSGSPRVVYTLDHIDYFEVGSPIIDTDCAYRGTIGPFPKGTTLYFRVYDTVNEKYVGTHATSSTSQQPCPFPQNICETQFTYNFDSSATIYYSIQINVNEETGIPSTASSCP